MRSRASRRANIDFPALHPAQAVVKASPARNRVVAAGRRCGKSELAVTELVECAATGGRAWYVPPTYRMGLPVWRRVLEIAEQVPGTRIMRAENRVELSGGGELSMRSADNPQALRGDGLDLVVIDEAAHIPSPDVWEQALRPALADRRGRAMFISSPNGHNWFHGLFQRGLDGGAWQSWQFPTAANPYIPRDEIAEARDTLPDRVFRQEFLAEFIADGAIFRGVTECVGPVGPVVGPVVIGADWGRHNDYTALTAIDCGQAPVAVVEIDRFTQIGYAVQRGRLAAMCARLGCSFVLAEKNSIGGPLIEQLVADGLPVTGFDTTAGSKSAIIDDLALHLEQQRVRLPEGHPQTQVLVNELQSYTITQRPGSKTWTYSAPAGCHDDCVMSLAIGLAATNRAMKRAFEWV